MILPVGIVGDKTSYNEYVIHPNQNRCFVKGVKVLISGSVPLATNTPGDGYKSRTNAGSYCTVSYARVFVEGEAMAHGYTLLDDDPAHFINKPPGVWQGVHVGTDL